jgi:hypothetical protein
MRDLKKVLEDSNKLVNKIRNGYNPKTQIIKVSEGHYKIIRAK